MLLRYILFTALFGCLLTGCKKFLDEKPDKKLVVPSTLRDVQALMDNFNRVNFFDAVYGEASADNYYITDADFASITTNGDKRMYLWEKDFLVDTWPNNWAQAYDVVFIANTVLEALQKIDRTDQNNTEWDHIKGQALYHRSKSFLNLAFIWALAWDSASATHDLGIPLRLTSDFNQPSVRASVAATYSQIINDLQGAAPLLPPTPVHVMRPSKAAVYGILARAFLSMRKYTQAGLYADSAYAIKNSLVDYNTLNAAAQYPFASLLYNNPEIVMENRIPPLVTLLAPVAKIDSVLYRSYATNDLRKTVFFSSNGGNTFSFKGSYEGGFTFFGGVSVPELLLTKAECLARAGEYSTAMALLNTLLVKRFKTGTFIPLTAANASEALNIILTERRKELIMRGLRWMDIKRLNKEGAGIVLTRNINGQTYVLLPNDLRYALPIPEDVIALSGMPQNPR